MLKYFIKEGRGAMARVWSFANVTACRAVSNLAWCRIFKEISCFSPLNIGTIFFDVVVLGTLPSHASLDSGVNEYLVGQRWQCVRLVFSAEMAASTVCSKKKSYLLLSDHFPSYGKQLSHQSVKRKIERNTWGKRPTTLRY